MLLARCRQCETAGSRTSAQRYSPDVVNVVELTVPQRAPRHQKQCYSPGVVDVVELAVLGHSQRLTLERSHFIHTGRTPATAQTGLQLAVARPGRSRPIYTHFFASPCLTIITRKHDVIH